MERGGFRWDSLVHFCVCRARLQDRSAALTALNILKLLKYEIIKRKTIKRNPDNIPSFLRGAFHRFQPFVLATEKSKQWWDEAEITLSSVFLEPFHTFVDQLECFQKAYWYCRDKLKVLFPLKYQDLMSTQQYARGWMLHQWNTGVVAQRRRGDAGEGVWVCSWTLSASTSACSSKRWTFAASLVWAP